MFRLLIISVLALALAGTAVHAETGVAGHALVVGSNAAGPGQTTLRYAEDDARRIGALLTELGGYSSASVDVVTRPTPAILRSRIAKLTQRVQADIAAGKQSRVFFYYSGHARATAIDLGSEPMPLADLRQRLFATGATLTVVVLDACQSGAFSRVKGAEPAADFSYNSRQQLDAKGVAVLASSTGSELSQESEQLRSSYFTHHLMIVGMRGAGDINGDGQVTVDEAYRYAYHQTLLATAVTAVGGQHVTLEVDLKGHGEIPLSYPRKASATISLPAALEGKALVQLKRTKSVVAETQKARGAVVRIAVAPGEYEVLVRQGNRLLRCQATAPGAVDLARCSNEAYVDGTRKGGGTWTPRWRIGVGVAVGSEGHDNFTQTLTNFGFREDTNASGNLSLGVTREVAPHILIVRERAGVIRTDVTTFAPGDRFKVTLTCEPGPSVWVDVGIVDRAGVDYPLGLAQQIACGNLVAVPGAFSITGHDINRVCARLDTTAAPTRAQRAPVAGDPGVACVTLRPE